MKKLIVLTACLCAIAVVVAAKPALATGTNVVSYVSNAGTDSPHLCTNPTADACATFAYALTQTASSGEIDCVNTGNYSGNFTIAQSVTIDCAGGVGFTFGQITVSGSDIIGGCAICRSITPAPGTTASMPRTCRRSMSKTASSPTSIII